MVFLPPILGVPVAARAGTGLSLDLIDKADAVLGAAPPPPLPPLFIGTAPPVTSLPLAVVPVPVAAPVPTFRICALT